MLIANKVLPQGRGLAPALVRRAAALTLDWDMRQKSRFDAVDSSGRAIGVVLPRGTALRGGDVLVGEDGTLVRVQSAAQSLLRVAASTPLELLRAAYHLGNRHVALDVRADFLQLEADHVLAALLRQMGLTVTETEAAFEPESGAYAAPSAVRPAIPIQAAAAVHVHGPGCGHSHSGGHDHG